MRFKVRGSVKVRLSILGGCEILWGNGLEVDSPFSIGHDDTDAFRDAVEVRRGEKPDLGA